MRNANQKQESPPNLGTKRACPSCATKFYDFGKSEVMCPKCESKLTVEQLEALRSAAPSPKRISKAPKKVVEEPQVDGGEVIAGETEPHESLEDLGDEEDVLEGIGAEESDEDGKY